MTSNLVGFSRLNHVLRNQKYVMSYYKLLKRYFQTNQIESLHEILSCHYMKYYHVSPQLLQIPQLRPTNKHQTGSNHHKLMPQLGLKIAPRSLTKRKNDQL